MNLPEKKSDKEVTRPVSRSALIVMLIIVVALALVSLFANYQRTRRDKLEEVIITPAVSPSAP